MTYLVPIESDVPSTYPVHTYIKIAKRRSFSTQKFGLRTKNLRSHLELTCFFSDMYFPTYNGVDPLNEIDCVKGKWSLPEDMGPVRCKSIKCPPFPDVAKEIETKCTQRDRACIAAGNYENEENCECHHAESVCKPEFITSYNKTFHEVEPQRKRSQSHKSGPSPADCLVWR